MKLPEPEVIFQWFECTKKCAILVLCLGNWWSKWLYLPAFYVTKKPADWKATLITFQPVSDFDITYDKSSWILCKKYPFQPKLSDKNWNFLTYWKSDSWITQIKLSESSKLKNRLEKYLGQSSQIAFQHLKKYYNSANSNKNLWTSIIQFR